MNQNKENLVTFDKDLMFCAVMKHKEPCIKFLESVLEKKIKDVSFRDIDVQKYLSYHPAKKAVILDVFFDDDTTMYNIEMQSTNVNNLLNRASIYEALLIADSVHKGRTSYKTLKSRYVIFLCTFDPFENYRYNKKFYKIESICKNVTDLPIDDGRHILFLNTKGVDGKISTNLEALFEYINGGKDSIGKETDNELVKLIDDYVEKTNADEQWRAEYMKYMFDMQDQYDKGVAEGTANAEAKAKEEKAQIVKNMYSKQIPLETIAECTALSLDEVNKIISAK